MRRLVLLALVLTSACGGSQSAKLRGSAEARVRFEGEASVDYRGRVEGDGARGLHQGTVRDAVYLAGKSQGLSVEGDPRLAELAERLAPHLREGGKLPPNELMLFLSRHLGLTYPDIHSLLVGSPNATTIGASVSDGVASYLARTPYDRFGAYTFEREGLTIAIVLLAKGEVELDPLPREVSAPAEVLVRGRLSGGLERPELIVIHPDGRSDRHALGRGGAFERKVELGSRGIVRLQLLAQGEKGTVPVATMPIAVGVSHPRELDLSAPGDDEEGRGEPRAVAASLFRLLSSTRAEAGLPPLLLDEGLSELARAHSVDMREASFLGHTSPKHGDPGERAERAGFRSGLILENVGRGPSALEVHEGLLASPAHHRNLLNPDVTHVGIGVEPDGRGDFLVTQIFLKMTAAIDVEEAREKLLAAINEGRKARGARPIARDPNLDAAADEGAREYFADPSIDQRDAVARANAAVKKFAIVFSRVGSVMTVVQAVEEAYRLEPTFEPGIKYVGIGVAQGERPDTPPNSIAIVVLMGWPR